jgi:vitellogenic carboxypeptidase-like protein
MAKSASTSKQKPFATDIQLIIYRGFQCIFRIFLLQYNAETAPVLLWLQGGPGGSSLFGLFNEHGPFIVTKDLTTLAQRSTTWALTHNLLYIDNPVGTGENAESGSQSYKNNYV